MSCFSRVMLRFLYGIHLTDDYTAEKNAQDCKGSHNSKDNLVTADTGIAIENCAIYDVHKSSRQIANEGGHRHGRTRDFARYADFIHRREENGTHRVNTGTDAEGDYDTGPDAHGIVGHPCKANQMIAVIKNPMRRYLVGE